MQSPQSLIDTLVDCLNQLDRSGAATAAAHLDAAIHALAKDLQRQDASKTA